MLASTLEGETVLLNPRTGKYFQLDTVGARMWAALARHHMVELAYHDLLSAYDVNEDRLRADLLAFAEELIGHGLLQIDPGQA